MGWGFLSFLVGAKFWRSLLTAVVESIPSVIAMVSVIFTTLWSLGTWLIKGNWRGLKQIWLTPVVMFPLLTTNGVNTYVSYHQGTMIKTEQAIRDLRKDYRFVPRKKSDLSYDYNFLWKGPLSWIGL